MSYDPPWNWLSESPAPDFQPGEMIEVMFHGGTTAVGNLHGKERWAYVVAWRRVGSYVVLPPHALPSRKDGWRPYRDGEPWGYFELA